MRRQRRDVWWRSAASRTLNRIRERTTNIHITDQGCMLRGYGRNVVDAVNRCYEVNTFVPALAYLYARNPVEIEVAHAEREEGRVEVSVEQAHPAELRSHDRVLARAAADFHDHGHAHRRSRRSRSCCSWRSGVSSSGRKRKGCSRCSASCSSSWACCLFGLGVVGEYIGRIYAQVRQRPRFVDCDDLSGYR